MSAKHIIAATDLQPSSRTVSQYAEVLARALGARLTLVNVAAEPEVGQDRDTPWDETREASDQDLWLYGRAPWEASRRRGALHRLLPAHGVEADVRVLVGSPARRIRDLTCARQVDLLVIGRGEERHFGPLVGRTARYLLEHVRVPVLVVPPRLHEPAGWSGPRVGQLVAIQEPHRVGELSVLASRTMARELRADASAVSADPRAQWQTRGEGHARTGALLGAALDLGADVVTVPAHNRLRRPRSPLGSMTEELLIRSPVPVLVFPVGYLLQLSGQPDGEGMAA